MAYNHGKAERRWRLWKEKEEKILRECGIDEKRLRKSVLLTGKNLIPTDGFTHA